jgi:hypothetical protein
MVSCIKTTVEISDSLLTEAKEVAVRENTTLRALVETGLRRELERREKRTGFVLRDASFGGRGLTPEFQGASWDKIRDAIYEGRGA